MASPLTEHATQRLPLQLPSPAQPAPAAPAAATSLAGALTRLPVLGRAAAAQLDRVEAKLRASLGGYDTTHSAAALAALRRRRARQLFGLLDPTGAGVVPVGALEALFEQAGLPAARKEVGRFCYEENAAGDGRLTLPELVAVLGRVTAFQDAAAAALPGGGWGGVLGLAATSTSSSSSGGSGGGGGSSSGGSSGAPSLSTAPPALGDVSFFFGAEGGSLPLREVLHRTFDDPSFSGFAALLGGLFVAAILVAIAVFIAQTVPGTEGAAGLFLALETICCVIFTADFSVRVFTAPSAKAYLLRPATLLDLATILPYYFDELSTAFNHSADGEGGAVMRVLRGLRIFRIFRVTKYLPYMSVMLRAATAALPPLGMALLVVSVGVLVLAYAAFYAERGSWDAASGLWMSSPGVPAPIQDIHTAVYWAIITLTTVGYGDVYPLTSWGRAIGFATALSGCVLISFPIAIYTDEFSREYGDFVKSKVLAAELGRGDLLERLLLTRASALQAPAPPRFPAGSSGGSSGEAAAAAANAASAQLDTWAGGQLATLLPAVPRNLRLLGAGPALEAAAASGSAAAVGAAVEAAPAENAAAPEGSTAITTTGSAADAPSGTSAADVASRSRADASFTAIWRMEGALPALLASAHATAHGDSAGKDTAPQQDPIEAAHAIRRSMRAWAAVVDYDAQCERRASERAGGGVALAAAEEDEDVEEAEAGSALVSAVQVAPVAPPPAPAAAGSPPGAPDAEVAALSRLSARLGLAPCTAAPLPGAATNDGDDSADNATAGLSPSRALPSRLRLPRGQAAAAADAAAPTAATPAAVPHAHLPLVDPLAPVLAAARRAAAAQRAALLTAADVGPSVGAGLGAGARAGAAASTAAGAAAGVATSVSAGAAADLATGTAAGAAATGPASPSPSPPPTTLTLASPPSPPTSLPLLATLSASAREPVLTATSFTAADLEDDDAVEAALLALLADHRQRVWGRLMALEAAFRDDLTIELARRWQYWMSAPGSAVADVAAPFVFDRGALERGLSFRRDTLRLGLVPARTSVAAAASGSPSGEPAPRNEEDEDNDPFDEGDIPLPPPPPPALLPSLIKLVYPGAEVGDRDRDAALRRVATSRVSATSTASGRESSGDAPSARSTSSSASSSSPPSTPLAARWRAVKEALASKFPLAVAPPDDGEGGEDGSSGSGRLRLRQTELQGDLRPSASPAAWAWVAVHQDIAAARQAAAASGGGSCSSGGEGGSASSAPAAAPRPPGVRWVASSFGTSLLMQPDKA